ncbi:cysteine hydrolase family protein [Tuberibacillus sp. Marseille-P3662]|uniref:cysteine hydrolase family protein n=1 Tax=Tuberibacillus sp. Marseille-P3662 TaxID=1965358 RepID=UPI000A1CC484|nr:isochorismatase family protein [Tuberibacillus sp. Marseille-P3662]
MRALLVIDVQEGLLQLTDSNQTVASIKQIMNDFQAKKEPIIAMRHFDEAEGSPVQKGTSGVNLHPDIEANVDHIVEKQTPSAFFNTSLQPLLEQLKIDHVTIVGYNTEFCCQFTAIAAYDRGYQVTFIEEATGTVNTAEDYELPDLNVQDFVETVLHQSGVIEVLNLEEYQDHYKPIHT